MRAPSALRSGTWSRGLRGRVPAPLALVATCGFLGMTTVAAPTPHPLLVAAGVVLGAAAARGPGGDAPLVLVVYLGLLWAVMVPETLALQTPTAAALLALVHVSCLLAAVGPPALVPDAAMLRRWLRRWLLLVGATLAVWAAARVAPPGLPTGGLVVAPALVLVAAWVAWLLRGLEPPRAERDS